MIYTRISSQREIQFAYTQVVEEYGMQRIVYAPTFPIAFSSEVLPEFAN